MSKSIHIGSVSIPLESYATSGTALLGTKGAGKTWCGKSIAEQLLDHGVPIVVFDPIGRWRYLKLAALGKYGRGFKVVVAGGREPDLPLTAESAPELVRAAIRENIPLVIDMFDRDLSKADWRRIVQSCFRTLLFENEGVRHIFLEETAEFAPQKVLDGATYAEVEKLVRMGGNASLGVTLINQRAQEVNKAVLDLCDNLVLMRQRGSHAIDALEKWIDKLDPTSAKAITRAMPVMGPGEAWVFTGSAETATHVHTGPIHSFHPDRQHPEVSARATSADTSEFVARMSSLLPAIAAEARANDPKALKHRIAELERQLASKAVGKEEASRADVDAAYKNGYDTGHEHGFGAGEQSAYRQFIALRAKAIEVLKGVRPMAIAIAEQLEVATLPEWQSTAPAAVTMHPEPAALKPATRKALGEVARIMIRAVQRQDNGAGEKLPKAERSILTVLAQYPAGRTKIQISILSNYSSSSSTFDNALGALRSAGYITKGTELTQITEAGRAALGAFEPLPSGRALVAYWLSKLGKAERAILEACVERYPGHFSKEDLGAAVNYSTSSSTFDNALGKLRALELIQRGAEIRASEDLFG